MICLFLPIPVSAQSIPPLEPSLPQGYAEWVAFHNLDIHLDGAPWADPDGDGIANINEFAFGGNPRVAGRPSLSIENLGQDVSLSFLMRASGLNYELQQSSTLTNDSWQALSFPGSANIPHPSLAPGYERMELQLPREDRMFFRLAADLPEFRATQFPAYIQLRRDVLIHADLWTEDPEILSAGFGFEGIQGVPGLTLGNLQLAVDAGAGVNLDWADLDPQPPFRNLTSAGGTFGIASVGFGGYVAFADAMPVVFSWPILPSSVSPEAFKITLNTGDVVFPKVAALNPNYDHNEKHVVVVFGEFGNRITPGQAGSIHPVLVEIADSAIPLMAVGPDGPVSLVGISSPSSNPYVAGPALVGAKLTHFSPVGDFPPAALAGSFPNDAFSHFGSDAEYRLRLFTSGGFSPDGVSGLMPDDFPRFFRLHATNADGVPVVIDRQKTSYDLGVGSLEVIGLAEVGAPTNEPFDRAYYVEDHDNYFDIILKGDEAAVSRITHVEIPTSSVDGYFDIYNPGGPGRTPDADTIYTRPANPQMQPVFLSLDDQRAISYAAQNLEAWDDDDNMPVVFRLTAHNAPDRFTTSSIEARAWIADEEMQFADVPFANEMTRPGVDEVRVFIRNDGGDRIYTMDADEIDQLSAPDSGWGDHGVVFGAFKDPWPGAMPVFRWFDDDRGVHVFSGNNLNDLIPTDATVAWYGATFQP